MRDRSQLVLPMELGVKIAENDPVRKLVEICEELDYTKLYEKYVRTWRKVSPETLFELVVFGYMQRRFSTRQIEEACRTDIRFMWILQGEPVPDHSTIDRFLDKRLADVIEDLFYQLVERLCVLGEVRFRNMFVDGTKLEANANRYTFVWKKAVEKNLKKLTAKIEAQLPVIAERYGMVSCVTIEDAYEALYSHAAITGLEFVHGSGKRKTQLQKDIELLGGFLAKKEEYLGHLGKMKHRNSYSKTDTDATFMRMKDDHMRNGQLKPGYNIQIGVESEYIVACGAFSNCTDVQTLIPFLERFHNHTGRRMEQIIATPVMKAPRIISIWKNTDRNPSSSQPTMKSAKHALAYSDYFYVEGMTCCDIANWLRVNNNALAYFGGITQTVTPDNCKVAVTENRDWVDPALNRDFQAWAEHNGTVIQPAKVRSPRWKPNVEGHVHIIDMHILIDMEEMTFYSLEELNAVL